MRSVADLLLFVPGASYNSGEGNRDNLVLRGNSSTADFFVDGVRDDVQYFRDFYNVERVEVLKGPNAMIFGRGGGGGIVNRVLKRPTLTPARALTASVDNWGDVRLAGDIDQPLSGNVGLRLNAMYEDGGSFRRHVDLERYGINPTLAILAGPATRIDLSYEHFHDRRTADRGVPADGDEPIRGFTRTFFGDPDDSVARADVDLASWRSSRFRRRAESAQPHDVRRLRQILPEHLPDQIQRRAPGSSRSAPTIMRRRARTVQPDRPSLGTGSAASTRRCCSGSSSAARSRAIPRRPASFPGGNTAPITDPTVDADVVFAPDRRRRRQPRQGHRRRRLHPGPDPPVATGSRSSPACASTASGSTSTICAPRPGEFSRRDNLWSPRLGLVLKPTPDLSLYASYSRSYLPQSGDQFSSLTDVTEGLKPERFDNYEVGAKWEVIDGLLATAALYQLDRANTRATDPRSDPDRADRQAAQPRTRARARAQRDQPLAGFGRLHAAEGRDRQTTTPRRRDARCRWSRATASRYGTATTSPRRSASASASSRDRNPMRRSATRVNLPGYARRRRRAVLPPAARNPGPGQCRKPAPAPIISHREQRQQHRARRAADGEGRSGVPVLIVIARSRRRRGNPATLLDCFPRYSPGLHDD